MSETYKLQQQEARDAVKRVLVPKKTESGFVFKEISKKLNSANTADNDAKRITTLMQELNNPIQHYTVDLSIKKFKQFLSTIPMLTKSERNKQITDYKKKSWGEYAEIIGFRGSFPTVPGALNG